MTQADTTAAREGSELTKSDASQPDGIYIVITIHSVTADIVYIYMLYKYIHVYISPSRRCGRPCISAGRQSAG